MRSSFILGCASWALFSCNLPDAADDAAGAEGEVIGEAALGLGEAGCATVNVSSASKDGSTLSYVTGTAINAQSDWLYDASGCTKQYVTEFVGLPIPANPGETITVTGSFLTGGFNEIDEEFICERTRLYVGVYVWNTSTSGLSSTHTYQAKGNWTGIGCQASSVSVTGSMGTDGYYTLPSAGRYKVRVASRAFFCSTTDCGSSSPLQTNFKVRNRIQSTIVQ